MVDNHDDKILAYVIHVQGGVDWVQVEATLDEIDQLYVVRHMHSNLPIFFGMLTVKFDILEAF